MRNGPLSAGVPHLDSDGGGAAITLSLMVFDVTSTTAIALSVPKKISKSEGTSLTPMATLINPCDGPEWGEMLVISRLAKNSAQNNTTVSVRWTIRRTECGEIA